MTNYYYSGEGGGREFRFCRDCYSRHHVAIDISSFSFKKEILQEKKHDKENVEEWIECDICKSWQHRICALLNTNIIEAGLEQCGCLSADFLMDPPPQDSSYLPRTNLSDSIETRLFKSLHKDREERAKSACKIYDEVEGAHSLTVRVVSSLDKLLQVKPEFRECFPSFPTEFPFKSKAILLFQKIQGVDTCLFGMYMHEYGLCSEPNRRSINIYAIDSNQHLIPNIRASTGESLRTFVYHEVLVGYLDYCKKSGFLNCYIWAWPPPKAEEWLFYCHPGNQKKLNTEKLRKWFKAMLTKAANESIIASFSDLHTSFLTSRLGYKVSGRSLPYFSGDYWPGEAECILKDLRRSGEQKLEHVVIERFGTTLQKLKKNFIVVHFHLPCTRCSCVIVSRDQWVCNECPNFRLCERCYSDHDKLSMPEKHPESVDVNHAFSKVPVAYIPDYKEDEKVTLGSEIFESPQTFLNFCKDNIYQFDTLARAKRSSQMILHQLLNQAVPAFVKCINCQNDIEGGDYYSCNVCREFILCGKCKKDPGLINHTHPLALHTDAERKTFLMGPQGVLHHLSECRLNSCVNPACKKFKSIIKNKERWAWKLVKLHSLNCTNMKCFVDGCRGFQQYGENVEVRFETELRKSVATFRSQSKGRASKNNGGDGTIALTPNPVTIQVFLDSLDLGAFAHLFNEEQVDMSTLKLMGDNDLKNLGIPMGPRKKILHAITPPPPPKRQRQL